MKDSAGTAAEEIAFGLGMNARPGFKCRARFGVEHEGAALELALHVPARDRDPVDKVPVLIDVLQAQRKELGDA